MFREVLQNFPDWEVLPAMPGWQRRGLSHYPEGDKFVRASGEEDWCNGFFVAVMGRVPAHINREKKRKLKENRESESTEQEDSLKKKKKKKKSKECESLESPPFESQDSKETEDEGEKGKVK